ncbi:right-handed parallel beta-helix repeat-containing protein [Chloroflexus sp.]|uniref:right-handed parallel beta-helix repeat-containing protein n=1 Tax=Chloroflexus sp. TaxID=1904827 RepID=UPI002ACED865|nr:right-handed parallel beta-helix repeat-containing protein [Chloroflexus sp.]
MHARRVWWWLASLLFLGSTLLWPRSSFSQTGIDEFFVDTLVDNPVTNINSHCTDDLVNANCSLRQAIAKANATPSTNRITIRFDLVTEGFVASTPYIITLSERLPPITRVNVTISAEVLAGTPQVAINANGADAGIVLNGSSAIIEGLAIYGASSDVGIYRGSGIYISSANNTIRNCYIGLQLDGTTPPDANRNRNGITIIGASAHTNQIGESSAPNTIAGNIVNGIVIENASQNTMRANRIGVLYTTATATRPNGGYGIQILSNPTIDPTGRAELNVIGGATNADRNIIGANGLSGIFISGSQTYTTTISSNLIGINLDSEPAVGNVGDGIRIEDGAQATMIGSPSSTQPLVISSNSGYGIQVRSGGGTAPVNTAINGYTVIGLNRGATSARPNGQGGIWISESAGNATIGSATTNVRIGGNSGPGIRVGSSVSSITITNAFVGVLPAGTSTFANAGGVEFNGTAQVTMTNSSIAANTGYDVRLGNVGSATLDGNIIGLSADGRTALGSAAAGIAVIDSQNVIIGSTNGNVIAAASGPGIDISGTSSMSITIRANILGLRRDATGDSYSAAAANAGPAIRITDASQVTIAGNTIGGNGSAAGIELSNASILAIQQNQIGWVADPGGDPDPLARPAGTGIALTNVMTATLSGNLVRLNAADGIRFTNVATATLDTNQVRANAGDGMNLTDTSNVTINNNNVIEQNGGDGIQVGGSSLGVVINGNRLRANAGYTVLVTDTARRVTITQNQMAANTLGGIELTGTTLYSGTSPDPDQNLTLPNHSIDPPFNFQVFQDGPVSGNVLASTAEREEDLNPVSACAGCTIHIYGDDTSLATPDGQGWQPLVSASATSAGVFNATLSTPPQTYRQLLFTATDRFGNTSAFRIFTPTLDLRLVSMSPLEQNAAPGSSVTYRLRLENHGTLGINRIRFTATGTLSGWTATVAPSERFTLLPGASQSLTVTLTLPTGTHPSVQVPITDTTTVSLTAPVLDPITQTLRTAVEALPILVANPATGAATVLPSDTYIYRHQITNNGNVTVPVDISATTADLIGLDTYNTTVLTPTITLAPGASAEIAVQIRVPPGAQTADASGNPVRATTVITATPRGFSARTITMTDTTSVGLRYAAELRSNQEQDVQAGREVVFLHTLRNTSNGRATFQLNFTASRGSTLVAFESGTSGVTITGNTITLDNVAGSGKVNQIVLRVRVRISELILPGTRETLRIWASIPGSTEPLSGAEVQDVAIVRDSSGIPVPVVWIPLVTR